MGERRISDPRLNDRQRITDPRLSAIKPLPSDKSDKFNSNRPRQNQDTYRHNDRSYDRNERNERNSKGIERRASSYETRSDNMSDYSDCVPPRYSPPPSLKPYTIPRRAGQKTLLKQTSLDSREGTFAIETIKNSLWNPETVMFEFTRIEMVNNDRLEAEYITKRRELKEAGRTTSEISDCFVFSHMRSKDECREICKSGIICKEQHHLPSLASCSLGDKNFGTYLCRCADAITKKIPTLQYGKESIMLICKIMKGRVKTINDHAEQVNPDLEPTPEFDCHISRRFQRGKKMTHDHIYDASQIYLYEINMDNLTSDDDSAIFARRPRQCLPYAVVYFKVKQNIQPIIEPKLPVKDPIMTGQSVASTAGQLNIEIQGIPEPTYEDCLKNLKYLWKGFYFMKTKFLMPIQIGIFTKKDINFPVETPNITISQKISWERLSKILPGKIYRKPPCKSLQPETEVVGIKFLHGEIHATDKASERVIQSLYSSWLRTNMAGVCTLSSGHKIFILPSSVFTEKLGVSDPSYPAILHCLFMKESAETTSMKGPWYDKFLLRQQLALHSRLCENEGLKDINTDINSCAQRKYAYNVNERQTIARYLAQIRRSQEKRGISKPQQPVDPSAMKKNYPNTFNPSANVAPIPNTNLNRVTPAPPSHVPMQVPMQNPLQVPMQVPIQVSMQMPLQVPMQVSMQMPMQMNIPPNMIAQPYNQCLQNNLLTTVPTRMNTDANLISPTSSDSHSPTEHGADKQAIDFCLSFKREGSEKTERVKLFPTPTSEKVDTPTSTSTHPQNTPPPPSTPPPSAPPTTKDMLEHIPPPLYTAEVTPISPPSKTNTQISSSSSPPVTILKDDVPVVETAKKEKENLKIDNEMTTSNISDDDSSQDSEDNLVINLDENLDETENDNTADVDMVQAENSVCNENITDENEKTNLHKGESETPVHSTPAKLNADDVFLKSSQNLLSQLSTVLPVPIKKESPKKTLPKSSSFTSPSKTTTTTSKPFSFSTMTIPSSPSKKTPVQFSSSQSTSSSESIPRTSSPNLSAAAVTYAVDFPEGCTSIPKSDTGEGDNYDNVTMDEGSEDSQCTADISCDHNVVDMECEETVEPKPSKPASPSLTQLTFTKEKILQQLSLLKAQTEVKKKLEESKKVKETPTSKYECDSDSGTESQGSEVIPFLGGDDESDDDTEVVAPPSPVPAPTPAPVIDPTKAEGLNAQKAEMAILNIGSEYYDQASPSVSDSNSLSPPVPPLPPRDKSPPPPPPPERPVGKVIPVTTTTTCTDECSTNGALSLSSTSAVVTVVTTVTSPVSSTRSTSAVKIPDSNIPFLSDDPNDRLSCARGRTGQSERLSSNERQLSAERPLIEHSPSASRSSSLERSSIADRASGTDRLSSSTTISSPDHPSSSGGLASVERTSTVARVPTTERPVAEHTTAERLRPGERLSTGERTSPLDRPPPPPLVHDTSNPPKRPIMEVSPVVRSTPGPWMSSTRSIPPLMSARIQMNPSFRPIDRPSGSKSTLDPYRNNNMTYPTKASLGVNREQADAMFQNRGIASDKNHTAMDQDPAARFKQPIRDNSLERLNVKEKIAAIPRAYRLPPSPRSASSRSHTPDDDSPLITPRTYRRSPSPSSDWEHRSSNRHRSSRRRSRSRSRSPYSRRYHRSRSPPRKRGRDRSPRYGDNDGEWEKSVFRKIYGSDIDVYKEDKPDRSERSDRGRSDKFDRKYERLDKNEKIVRAGGRSLAYSPASPSPPPVDKITRAGDRSLAYSPASPSPPPPPPPRSPPYLKNNPKESLDEYINRNNTLPNELTRPRPNNESGRGREGERPSTLPPRDHGHPLMTERNAEQPTIKESWDEPLEERFQGDRCISGKSISKKWIEDYWL